MRNSIFIIIMGLPIFPEFKTDLKTHLRAKSKIKNDSIEEEQIGSYSNYCLLIYVYQIVLHLVL